MNHHMSVGAAGAVVFALALTLAACGDDSSTDEPAAPETTVAPVITDPPTTDPPEAAAPTNIDPCAVVTLEDANALAGAELQEGIVAGPPEDVSCTYSATSGPTAQVEFYAGDGAKKILDIDQELGHEFTTLEDVGDEAYLEDFNLFFRGGERWYALRLVRLEEFDAYRQPMIDLAKKVLETV